MSDGGFIGFSLPELAEAAGQLADVLREMTTSAERLHDHAISVCSQWEGEARDEFVALMADWERQESDLRAQQRWLHGVVSSGHANYAAAHGAVLRGWGAV